MYDVEGVSEVGFLLQQNMACLEVMVVTLGAIVAGGVVWLGCPSHGSAISDTAVASVKK